MNTAISVIAKYFPYITKEQAEQFAQLKSLYEIWNAQINVISRKDIDALYERHVLHSLGIAKVIQFKEGTRVLDVGTGGGFPGIPLAILFPECTFHLVDSIGKKIKVVQEVTKALGLTNIQSEQARVEELKDSYDFIVSRAVTDLSVFYGWIRKKINRNGFNALANGVLYLKGGDLQEELTNLEKMMRYLNTVNPEVNKKLNSNKITLYDLSTYFEEEFFESKKVVHIKA
jgi:16S rRNA (guanine527-N7)-methyltransferase